MITVFSRIETLLRSCASDTPHLPPTALFNEGWMLRLTMDWFARAGPAVDHPLTVPPGTRWYSEALLPSAFRAKSRGDPLAESATHADGIIGDFQIASDGKGYLTLPSESRHFVVLEAKMSSSLAKGTKNAPGYNQAARSVACIAEVLRRAGKQPAEMKTLAFYVLAPADRIIASHFDEHLDKAAISDVVQQRMIAYGGMLDHWFHTWFLPTLANCDITAISWENLIDSVAAHDAPYGKELDDFYQYCLAFNQPIKGKP